MNTFQKFSASLLALCAIISTSAANPALPLQNEPVDVSPDFRDFSDLYYLADKLADFDPATASGKITYQRAEYFTRQAFAAHAAHPRDERPAGSQAAGGIDARRAGAEGWLLAICEN